MKAWKVKSSSSIYKNLKKDPLYLLLNEILESKLTGKSKLLYGKPQSHLDLLNILYRFVCTLKRNGTCFFGSVDRTIPLGLALRTPTYLTTKFCVEALLKHGHVELLTEQNGKRVLIKGLPSCFEISEQLSALIEENQQGSSI